MNSPIREIYADYQYELFKISLTLKDLSLAQADDIEGIGALLERSERLEALIDLYAYLLACQGGSRR